MPHNGASYDKLIFHIPKCKIRLDYIDVNILIKRR